MQELLNQYVPYLDVISQSLLVITLAATLIVRITPTPNDDTVVGKISGYLLKVLKWLPTIGVNPQTKKLEEALEDLKGK